MQHDFLRTLLGRNCRTSQANIILKTTSVRDGTNALRLTGVGMYDTVYESFLKGFPLRGVGVLPSDATD